jgi:hypothetical protein
MTEEKLIEKVAIAAVALVNEWRRKRKPVSFTELVLWGRVDKMQGEDTMECGTVDSTAEDGKHAG